MTTIYTNNLITISYKFYYITQSLEGKNMDNGFLDEYFNELNTELKNKRFTSWLKNELENLDKDKLKKLIEEHF